MIDLSSHVVKAIDAGIGMKRMNIYPIVITMIGLKDWISLNNNKERTSKLNGEMRKNFVSRWIPNFKREGNDIVLFTPEHKIKKEYNSKKINIKIFNNDKLILLNEKPIIEEIIGGYSVRRKKILIENPLGKLTYILSDGSNEIYNSKNDLIEIIFYLMLNGNELKNHTDYTRQVVFCYKKITERKISVFYRSDYYEFGGTVVDPEELYYLGHNIIALCSIQSRVDRIKI